MEEILFRARWNLVENLFDFLLLRKNEQADPWKVEVNEFLSMIVCAEQQLLTLDGQNIVNKSSFYFETVTKDGEPIKINLQNVDKDTFVQMTAYLRKVYESWKTHNAS